MRTSAALLILLAAATAVLAQPAGTGQSPKEVALDALLSERGPAKELEAVIAAAREKGIAAQAILEARFLYHVDRREDDAIAAMLPEFTARRDTFAIEDSAIFALKEDWHAVVEYVQAIAALKKGDKDGFKSHITEAFWLSPRQASAFAPHIDRMRLEEAMRQIRIDFGTRLTDLDGAPVLLKEQLAGRKAMVLHFWSPASPACEASMPDYAATAKALGEKGIAMVSIMPGEPPAVLTAARALFAAPGSRPPGAWLADRPENPLARELRVQALPVFVLVSNEGRVLFNGEPADDGFWDALKAIDPQLARPDAPGGGE